jgi:hypothetical protein
VETIVLILEVGLDEGGQQNRIPAKVDQKSAELDPDRHYVRKSGMHRSGMATYALHIVHRL